MYKARIHDSIYVMVYDKNKTLRIEYLQPHAHSIYGRVKVYNKKGELTSLEYYSYGEFSESNSPNHHDVSGSSTFRAGLWKYYSKGVLSKTERYELLHTKDKSNYYVLITELTFEKDGTHVKKQNEYISHIEDLEFQHKPLKFKKPMFSVKGANL
ncbi:MAG: hypothetical protein ACPGEG_10325 [Salibacteraceae bacterium]